MFVFSFRSLPPLQLLSPSPLGWIGARAKLQWGSWAGETLGMQVRRRASGTPGDRGGTSCLGVGLAAAAVAMTKVYLEAFLSGGSRRAGKILAFIHLWLAAHLEIPGGNHPPGVCSELISTPLGFFFF